LKSTGLNINAKKFFFGNQIRYKFFGSLPPKAKPNGILIFYRAVWIRREVILAPVAELTVKFQNGNGLKDKRKHFS